MNMGNTILVFMGNLGFPEFIILLILVGIPGILWIWALIDLLTGRFANSIEKLIWLVAVIFIPFLGALLYILIGRRQKIRTANV
ncbi:PLDc_N domain-containing protein [Rufibacter hautae]|uniref:PLDc_N domain-containing protein n=2 Tax=Rufibacter hautae TaxID=2595005 RepID=A0A5B6TJ63_9BACT|nr:PLDc_N domain-containing protein [Rufibacter hautae]